MHPSLRIRPALATALAAALPGSCSSDLKKNNCPYAAVLAPASTLTTFRDGMKDDPAGVEKTAKEIKTRYSRLFGV